MIEQPIRRTISQWGSAPMAGTPFHILNTLRFNPLANRMEALCHGDDGKFIWAPFNFGENEPSVWLRQVPLPYEVPTSFAFTLTYEARPKTWRERLLERLLGRLSDVTQFLLFHAWRASAMSAGTAATTQIGAGLQPASAVPDRADARPNSGGRQPPVSE